MRKIISICCAVILSAILVNGVMFFYGRPVAWIDTPNGASGAIRRPGALLVHGTEGYGVNTIDALGYLNYDYPLANDYVLMMGASHSLGKEMKKDNTYSTLVNKKLSNDSQELRAVNIGSDGHFLPAIIKHFQAATQIYPDSKCVVIELFTTDYSLEELQGSMNQVECIDYRDANQVYADQGMKSIVKSYIKEWLPLLAMAKSHIETVQKPNSTGGYNVNEEKYRTVITDCLTLIRSQYDDSIVFIYHPVTEIQKDGSIKIVRSQTFDIFKEVCEETKIDFIDTGDAFVEHYNKYHELPYGFANTTPGSGHLNEVGHKIMADAIIDYLEEVNCK